MLCRACKRMFQGDLTFADEHSYVPTAHHLTAEDLCAASEQKCRICTRVWRTFSKNGHVDLLNLQPESSFTGYLFNDSEHAVGHIPPGCYELYIILDQIALEREPLKGERGYPQVCPFVLQPVKGTFDHSKMASNLCTLSNDTDITSLIHQHEIALNTGSDDCWRLAQTWFMACTAQHKKCNRPFGKSMFHPTRLIESQPTNSGSGLDLRITYQVPPDRPYMTLSHTWGTAKFMKLTKSNSQSLQDGFQSKDLPKTFRDAIKIARKFGVNYLWIDSLCILQDSADDWTREAAQMGDVYYYSLCNIAATGASDSGQGCFFDRDRSLITPCTVKSEWNNKVDQEYHAIEALFWQEQMFSAPLNRRAWVIQERLLSPRVLHYGKDQLLWECHELDACETYPHGLPSIPANAHTLFKGLDPEIDGRRLRKVSNNEPDPDLDPYHLWAKVVQAYTSCDLSEPGDKLIAISGIAKRFRSMLNDAYLAGLWLRVLPTQLLWHVDDCKKANGLPARRPTSYRAPSWSWASVDGKVSTGDINIDGVLITVVNTHVKPFTDDVTGQIEDGYIVLQGKLFPSGFYR